MLNEFKDTAGRVWNLAIVVSDLKQCREKAGVELGKLVGQKLDGLIALIADPEKFCAVLWVLIERQAMAVGVTPEAFGEAMGGDAIEAAVHAFVGALADFSQSASRKLLREWAKTQQEFETQATLMAVEKMHAQVPRLLQKLDQTLSEAAGNSPESVGLTHGN